MREARAQWSTRDSFDYVKCNARPKAMDGLCIRKSLASWRWVNVKDLWSGKCILCVSLNDLKCFPPNMEHVVCAVRYRCLCALCPKQYDNSRKMCLNVRWLRKCDEAITSKYALCTFICFLLRSAIRMN